jgi:hypothetical protein
MTFKTQAHMNPFLSTIVLSLVTKSMSIRTEKIELFVAGRASKRHANSDDRRERRDTSPEKKKRYNEGHARLQRMLRNSVLNDSRENLISERRKLERVILLNIILVCIRLVLKSV